MPEERNRPPQGGNPPARGDRPDTASIISQLFRDEPEATQAEETPPEETRTEAAPESEAPVGVLVPPDQAEEPAAAPSEAAEAPVPVTPEGVVEAPPVPTPEAGAEEAARAAAGARWYVIHTYSGYENKVRTNLERRVASMSMQEKIFRVLVPTEDEIEIKDGKRRIAKKKVFPGYVLVEMIMDDNSWYVVRNTPGVTGFVGSGTKPLPLQEREVKAILRQLGDETPKFRITYQKGSAVRINSGPFMDFSGVVDEILPEKEKVRVLVSIFGRETPVELDFAQVEKI